VGSQKDPEKKSCQEASIQASSLIKHKSSSRAKPRHHISRHQPEPVLQQGHQRRLPPQDEPALEEAGSQHTEESKTNGHDFYDLRGQRQKMMKL